MQSGNVGFPRAASHSGRSLLKSGWLLAPADKGAEETKGTIKVAKAVNVGTMSAFMVLRDPNDLAEIFTWLS